jgi:hypothetical protein
MVPRWSSSHSGIDEMTEVSGDGFAEVLEVGSTTPLSSVTKAVRPSRGHARWKNHDSRSASRGTQLLFRARGADDGLGSAASSERTAFFRIGLALRQKVETSHAEAILGQ